MSPDRSPNFLQMIRRAKRGRLKVYLGYAAGVGKTSLMLQEGHRLKKEGVDVVAGWVETHARPYLDDLNAGLETVAPRQVNYHGVSTQAMDLDGVLKRRPQVVLVDELAHSNPPGSRNAKRYQDVQELRAAGIHVISTLNVQHLESLYDTVERMTGVKVRERLPDLVLNDSDEVVNVDLSVADLLKRVREGQVLPPERVEEGLRNFFRSDNLEQLRELALRELASRIDFRRREEGDVPGWSEQFLVALGPEAGTHAALLRYAARLAGKLNRNWYAVHVQAPRRSGSGAVRPDPKPLTDTLTLANQLGAVVFTVKGEDVAEAILDFARRYRVGSLIVGKPARFRWFPWARGERVVERLLAQKGLSVQVVDTAEAFPSRRSASTAQAPESAGGFQGLLTAPRIILLDEPVGHRDLVQALARLALHGTALDPVEAAAAVMDRESRGSTFLNSGLALPHASLSGLAGPRMALALTKAGLKAPAPGPVEAVFLLLTPANSEERHLELLSSIGRSFQDASVRSALAAASTPREALEALEPEGSLSFEALRPPF